MKYLFACICFAVVACISANPAPIPARALKNQQQVAYQAIPVAVQGHGSSLGSAQWAAQGPAHGQAQWIAQAPAQWVAQAPAQSPLILPLAAAPWNPQAGASAAAASASLNSGLHQQWAVPSYEIVSGPILPINLGSNIGSGHNGSGRKG